MPLIIHNISDYFLTLQDTGKTARGMKVYFYHTQDLSRIYKEWKEGIFPGHLLYGATHLHKHGIETIMHPYKPMYKNRLKLTFLTAWRILTCREKYDVLYASSFFGIELLVFLRAIRLYRKPIVIWHHQPIRKANSRLRELFAKIFYRGFDHMFFFSDTLISQSLKSSKATADKMQTIHWGADLDFYDRIISDTDTAKRKGFISTGKECRDMPTLVKAFAQTDQHIDIHIAYSAGKENYKDIFSNIDVPANVTLNFINGLIPYELSKEVSRSSCVAICCMETHYTVGLTTLVEAMALGLPVICSRNTTFAMDIDKEKAGITVPYYDVKGWQNAIEYIATHPEEAKIMGRNGRALAERLFNLEKYSAEVAQAILKIREKK
jgi:glycosyltransferase involved in cell wall biosynthesis